MFIGDYDQTRTRFFEIWLRGDSGNLTIDLGKISEDYNGDGVLNTEDVPDAGLALGNGFLEENEDTGLDGCFNNFEDGFGNLVVIEDPSNKNTFKGCYLGFPQYGVCINVRNNDFLAMNVHEWHCNTEFIPENENVISATTDYASNIVCSVEKENIFGTQFHPEKSDKIGLKMIDNFLRL